MDNPMVCVTYTTIVTYERVSGYVEYRVIIWQCSVIALLLCVLVKSQHTCALTLYYEYILAGLYHCDILLIHCSGLYILGLLTVYF